MYIVYCILNVYWRMDKNIILKFEIKAMLCTLKTPTKFDFNPSTFLNDTVSTDRQADQQTDRQTYKIFFLASRTMKSSISIKIQSFFYATLLHTSCVTRMYYKKCLATNPCRFYSVEWEERTKAGVREHNDQVKKGRERWRNG